MAINPFTCNLAGHDSKRSHPPQHREPESIRGSRFEVPCLLSAERSATIAASFGFTGASSRMHPILFRLPSFLGGFPIRSFGVMVALGFLAGLYFTQAIARRRGIKPELIQDLFFWVLLGGILGA